MKKLLFIVNGLGMGNSTRCESIIEALIAKNFDIDILTSGNGVYYFKNRDYYSNLYEFKSFYYGSKDGELNIWRTLLAIPHFVLILFRNIRFLKNLLQSNNYSGVVIDSDYTMIWLKRWVRIPIFALNNADIVVEECKKLPAIPKEIRMQYLIEKCDNWYHRTIPTMVLSPAIYPDSYMKRASLKHFPPFTRDGMTVRPPENSLNQILVMLSGSQFGTSTDFLKHLKNKENVKIHVVGRDGESNDWVTFHGKIDHNKDIINQSDMMVINAGFSAVSEAVVLRKPVIVIPVANHAEQFINAITVEKAGLGLVANMENIIDKINDMISRFPEFVKAHRQFNCSINGAEQAADLIEQEIR